MATKADDFYHGLSVGTQHARRIRHRLEEIAAALHIPRPVVDGAMSSDTKLIAFVLAARQSFDWVVLGDMRGVIRALHRGGAAVWGPPPDETGPNASAP